MQVTPQAGSVFSACAVATQPRQLLPSDLLVLPHPKRMVVQRHRSDTGATVLRLFYGTKEIEFDEAKHFAFGEALARQQQFVAGDSLSWGSALDWDTASGFLSALIREGILVHDSELSGVEQRGRTQPSPLPSSNCPRACDWSEAFEITRNLAGRAVEPGWLEVFVPIFRVAHIYMDADGRQVGEANVFPRALRRDVPTEWMTCIYPGSRYLADRPMNVTALKAMREHWPQMMAALLRIRCAMLVRSGVAENHRLMVGDLERLATAVLCVPTWQLMRTRNAVGNGALHPALSSLFRVTDGLRMVMHHMLFVPAGEPTRSPQDVVTSQDIHDYAERNFSFYSDTGVCAGPRHMVQEFLSLMVEGAGAERYGSIALDPAVEDALEEIDVAIDYALLGLQSFAVTFSFWPKMTRIYERLAEIATSAVAREMPALHGIAARLDAHVEQLRSSLFLAKESWRRDREHVYRELFDSCGRLLVSSDRQPSRFPDQLSEAAKRRSAELAVGIAEFLGDTSSTEQAVVTEAMAHCIADFAIQTQSILQVATSVQTEINRILGRPQPRRALSSSDIEVHSRLQGNEARRLPDLFGELAASLGMDIRVTSQAVTVARLERRSPLVQEFGRAV